MGIKSELYLENVGNDQTHMPMVLKTGTVKEPENELITGFMVGPGSDRWSNL